MNFSFKKITFLLINALSLNFYAPLFASSTTSHNNTQAIILAAGRSTRFKSEKSKLPHDVCGQPMVMYSINVFKLLNIPMTIVVGHQADTLKKELEKYDVKNIRYALQEKQLGTGHALACSRSTWTADQILIINADMPLITKELIEKLLIEHASNKAAISFFTTEVANPYSYGRVIKENGIIRIVEEKDCTDEQRKTTCVNAGVYLMQRAFLEKYISKLSGSAVTGEIYLPDLIRIAGENGLVVNAISVPFDNVRGVNTLQELADVEQIKRLSLDSRLQ